MPESPTHASPEQEAVLRDARARIIWGEPPAEVAEWLVGNGVDRYHVSQKMKEFMRERAAAIRGEGVAEMWKGVGIFIVAATPVAAVYFAGYIAVKLFAVCAVAALYGACRFIHGLDLAVTGRMRGSISRPH